MFTIAAVIDARTLRTAEQIAKRTAKRQRDIEAKRRKRADLRADRAAGRVTTTGIRPIPASR